MNAPSAMRQLRLVPLALVAVLFGASSGFAQEPTATLVLLDGQSVPVKSLSLAGGKLSGEGVPEGLTLDELRRIELPGAATTEKPVVVVELRGGGRVQGKAVTIGDDRCQIQWALGEDFILPIDVVRAVRCEPAAANPEFDKSLAAPAADADRIFFKVDDRYDSLKGLIVSLTADQLTFQLEGAERMLPRAQLYGIVVAQAQAEDAPTQTVVSLRDGSRLAGSLTGIAGGQATIELPGGRRIGFRGPRPRGSTCVPTAWLTCRT